MPIGVGVGIEKGPVFPLGSWFQAKNSFKSPEWSNLIFRQTSQSGGLFWVLSTRSGGLSLDFFGRSGILHDMGYRVLVLGNLYLGTGDYTFIQDSNGYSPLDERIGREVYDSQRKAAYSMDLRGKILRIHPEASGGYSIPEGNLFLVG